MDATAVERTEEAPVQENWITHSSYLPPLTCNIKQWQLGAKELYFILGQKNPLTEDYFNFFFSFFQREGEKLTQNGRRLGGTQHKKNSKENHTHCHHTQEQKTREPIATKEEEEINRPQKW